MNIILYTGPHCHLCDLAKSLLDQAAQSRQLRVNQINVRSDSELYHLYGARIPVLKREDNQQELGWPFDTVQLEQFLQ